MIDGERIGPGLDSHRGNPQVLTGSFQGMILGREVEQAEIDKFLSLVRGGEGGLLVLVGDPGIGKTTLLDWTAASATGTVVLRAYGRESEADLPFVAIADLLRPVRDHITKLPDLQARALHSALALAEPGAGDRGAVNTAALNLLDILGREGPVLVLVDDYHWLDSASREVIDFVARRTHPLGVGLLLTTRGPYPIAHQGFVHRLGPLPLDAASAVVRGRAPASPEAVERILALAAGNPLALVELPMSLTPEQLETTTPVNRPVSISTALEKAFLARLEGLPDTTRSALLCAAEDGSQAVVVVLRAMSAMGLDKDSLDPALQADLIAIDGQVIHFRHPLVRSVVHQSAEPGAVRRIHHALAQSVDDEDHRAWHRAAATIGPDDDVAGALEKTARHALARGAAASAANAFERASELSGPAGDRSRRLAAAARAAHQAGDMGRTARLIDATRVLARDTAQESSLTLLEADISMRRGDFAGAHRRLRRMAAEIADDDPHRAATMLLLAAKLKVYRLEAKAAAGEVHQALALVPDAGRDVVHHTAVAMTKTMTGHRDARAAVFRARDAAIAAPYGHTHTLGIGWPLVWLEEYEAASDFISRSVGIQREGGHLAYLPQALMALAELDFRTGRWDMSRVNASEALRLFEEGNQPTEAAIASAALARLDAVSGEEEGARDLAAAAERNDVRSGLRAATAHAEAAIGLLDLGQGRYPDAIGHLRQARSIVTGGGVGEPWLLPVDPDLAEALIRADDRAAGCEVASHLIEQGTALGRRSAVAAGLRCLGLAAPGDSYRTYFEDAISIHREMETPFELGRTQLCYGERLRRNRKRVEARATLRNALTVFESLGAGPWIDRARAELAASGETLQRRSPMASLTPQERQVALVVSTGATNREAAAVLFVSPKTIEFHLGNVYRKLGVRSRTELANALNGGGSGVIGWRPEALGSGAEGI
jgi:DNA-binding CsgD family transcriptional regulator